MSLLPTLAFLGLLVLMAEGSDPRSYACGRCDGYKRNPVCGYHNNVYRTYDNDCQCSCRGITRYTYGACTQKYCAVPHPVCGYDGRTYSNPCVAASFGVKVHGWGNCGPQLRVCASGLNYHAYDPVCCTDGYNYYNKYYANCAGATIARDGRVCRSRTPAVRYAYQPYCGCSGRPYEYVCGSDLRTYDNPCRAGCAGVQVKHVGKCQAASYYGNRRGYGGCNCGQVSYSPVCCDNYATFDNYCLAGCAGRRVLYAGRCRSAYSRLSYGAYQRGTLPVYSNTYYRTSVCDLKCAGYNDRHPVCCSNYKTYYNACQARCAGAHIFYYGACDRQVYYARNYGQCGNCYGRARNLVCGANGRTYYNQCFCDCASSDYYSYRRIGYSSQGYCSGFAQQYYSGHYL